MKVLIPTNDCLTIAPDFDRAKAFRLITILNGSVLEDTLIGEKESLYRLMNLKNTLDTGNSFGENYRVAITLKISEDAEQSLLEIDYAVLHSEEPNIINALNSFLRTHAIKESNYCCSP